VYAGQDLFAGARLEPLAEYLAAAVGTRSGDDEAVEEPDGVSTAVGDLLVVSQSDYAPDFGFQFSGRAVPPSGSAGYS
jgi:hypothetical protein